MQKSTKIITTVSDRRCDVDFIRSLFEAGMNVVRMNSAHLGEAGITRIVENCRQVSLRIGIMIDTKGPEIRTTANEAPDDKIFFREGNEVEFVGNSSESTTRRRICLNYADIASDVHEGMHFLIDDGELDFLIEGVDAATGVIRARCLNDGQLGSRKSVNIPGSDIRLPALSERDKATLAVAARLGVDFVAHSFVRSASDIGAVQDELDRLGSDMKIIAKIENQQGVDNFDEILEASYGIMIARGDLGIEVAAERIPVIQHEMIQKCIATHHPVIVATQMLHSMITNPRPTRAEVSDIANAVYQRTDCLMLSGETANGRYPVEAVRTMAGVAQEVEASLSATKTSDTIPQLADAHVTSFLARQAVVSEREIGVKAIVADAVHGRTARFIASFRGSCPVYAICYRRRTMRWLSLSYGIKAYYYKDYTREQRYPLEALRDFVEQGLLTPSDRIAFLGAINGTGATFLEINAVQAILENGCATMG
ncbi:MAG: pyruvate kinase [Muribaculaceae bacterium]|nr:pyruvate kinase [Muribaculaceae bacterium]